jgi:hypothetical protein
MQTSQYSTILQEMKDVLQQSPPRQVNLTTNQRGEINEALRSRKALQEQKICSAEQIALLRGADFLEHLAPHLKG